MIPKRIIITHKSKAKLTPLMRFCYQRAVDLHPEWDIRFFSDKDCADFVQECGNGYKDLYFWYKHPLQRSNLFRYLAIKNLGGFSLSTDFMLDCALDDLILHEAVFPWDWVMDKDLFDKRFPTPRQPARRQIVGQYAFGAVANHWSLTDILECLLQQTHNLHFEEPSDTLLFRSTGSGLVTKLYYEEEAKWNEGVTMLVGDTNPELGAGPVYGPKTWHRFGHYGVHMKSYAVEQAMQT